MTDAVTGRVVRLGQARPAERDECVGDLVLALRAEAAGVQGPDWREQSWDSYRWDLYALESWCVTVPFAALTFAHSPVVPVAAAERLLALPEVAPAQPWARPEPGRAYRHYWTHDKRFLALVADIAARFPDDGGRHLATSLRRTVNGLPERDRAAVELHCAAVGLTESDPARLSAEVLAHAAREDLGSRGELVLQALRRVDELSGEERARLLASAADIARRCAAFVASNPFAACVEALSRADLSSPAELLELIARAARIKALDWAGWEHALHAAGRATTGLAARLGTDALRAVLDGMAPYRRWFPGLDAWLLLAGAQGLTEAAAIEAANEAIRTARHAPPSELGLRAEAGAARLLADSGVEGGLRELSLTATRLAGLPASRAQQVGLQTAITHLAQVAGDDPSLLSQAVALAGSLRESEPRWLAHMSLARVVPGALETARRTARWWLLRRPPFDVLVLLAHALADRLSGGPRHPAVVHTIELALDAASGERFGVPFAQKLMGLGPLLSEPQEAAAVSATLGEVGTTWWRLPLLAVVADGAAAWLLTAASAADPRPLGRAPGLPPGK
jgi:hypothetical protein